MPKNYSLKKQTFARSALVASIYALAIAVKVLFDVLYPLDIAGAGALEATLYYGLPVIMDQINGAVVYSGKFGNVLFYLISYLVCVTLGSSPERRVENPLFAISFCFRLTKKPSCDKIKQKRQGERLCNISIMQAENFTRAK